MRDFYKSILENLYIYCGNRQVEKMSDPEITFLLDGLCRLSKVYEYIPEQSQQEIILTCLITDKEYQNINVRLVSKWFELNGKKYFKEAAHKENPLPENYKPLEGKERDKAIQEFLDSVINATTNLTNATEFKGSGTRIREELEQHNIVIPKDKQYKPFIIQGLEIFAQSEEQAIEIYNQTVSEGSKLKEESNNVTGV